MSLRAQGGIQGYTDITSLKLELASGKILNAFFSESGCAGNVRQFIDKHTQDSRPYVLALGQADSILADEALPIRLFPSKHVLQVFLD
jgi:hypothetical protein